jgi:hypothetical protein
MYTMCYEICPRKKSGQSNHRPNSFALVQLQRKTHFECCYLCLKPMHLSHSLQAQLCLMQRKHSAIWHIVSSNVFPSILNGDHCPRTMQQNIAPQSQVWWCWTGGLFTVSQQHVNDQVAEEEEDNPEEE